LTPQLHAPDPLALQRKKDTPYLVGLKQKTEAVERAFHRVRCELGETGLLADGVHLDQIELTISLLPSINTQGYFYYKTGFSQRLLGYKEGVIYLPGNSVQKTRAPGSSLPDVIRHEFGHAWYWLEPRFFEKPWFRRAFGAEYSENSRLPYESWFKKVKLKGTFCGEYCMLRSDHSRERYFRKLLSNEFVSEYAVTNASEDFAETFMTFLRCRDSLGRFEHRAGVYRKLRAVEKATSVSRRKLGL
jgi:hypothetical protein